MHFLRCFAARFSAAGSFHVPSRAFCGPQGPADAHDARPYSGLGTPPKKANDLRNSTVERGCWAKRCLMLFGGPPGAPEILPCGGYFLQKRVSGS